MNEKHQFIIPAVIFAVIVSIVGGFWAVRAQSGWLRSAAVSGEPALSVDGRAEIAGGAILNTANPPATNGLIVANGNVGIGTTGPKDKLDINGNYARGSKTIGISSSWTSVLSVDLGGNHRAAYAKIFYGGIDWGCHSAARFEAEFDIIDGAGGYEEPGNLISQQSNTAIDQIQARLTHIDPNTVNIELRTVDVEGNGFACGDSTPNGVLTYEVGGNFASIGLTSGTITTSNSTPQIFTQKGNVGIGTTTPAAKLDVAGFFKVEPPGVTQSTYNYTTQSASLSLLPLYTPNRCSWAPDDTIWENPPSPDAVPAGDENCYDINNTIMKAHLGICMQSTTPTTVQCPCDTGGSNFQCRNTFNLTCYQESGEIQLTSPLTIGACYDRGNSGTQYDTYDLFVMIRYYSKVTSTPWGKVSIGSSSQSNNLCLNGDCRASWPASSSGNGTVTSVATGAGLTGGTITASGTISISSPTCTSSQKLLWNGSAFTCDTDQVGGAGSDGLGTGSSGTAGYLAKWKTGGSTIGDSIIQDNGTSVGIGVAPGTFRLAVNGQIKADDLIGSGNLRIADNGNGNYVAILGGGTSNNEGAAIYVRGRWDTTGPIAPSPGGQAGILQVFTPNTSAVAVERFRIESGDDPDVRIMNSFLNISEVTSFLSSTCDTSSEYGRLAYKNEQSTIPSIGATIKSWELSLCTEYDGWEHVSSKCTCLSGCSSCSIISP